MAPAADNIGGTSALPYHLMVHRADDVDVEVFTFNTNGLSEEKIAEVEQELRVKIHVMAMQPWLAWLLGLKGALSLLVRLLLPYPPHYYLRLNREILESIRAMKPNGVWIYGEELTGISRQLDGIAQVHTGPDCEVLYYERLMVKTWLGRIKRLRCRVMMRKFRRMAANAPTCAHYHVVGAADCNMLQSVNHQVDVRFLRHPHYNYSAEREIRFGEPRIRLVLAGRNDIYMHVSAEELVDVLAANVDLAEQFEFTFLGKGWETMNERLRQAGWQSRIITFAPDYAAELCRHDVQLTPIAIGTGTKGKVLDAITNGLLVIGTPYAMENIAVRHGVECLQYEQAIEVVEMLRDIANNRPHYEAMARAGRNAVLENHNRARASKELFEIFASARE
ncbi:MAG: glycosyltransferase [Muribaculaceae bacterium]